MLGQHRRKVDAFCDENAKITTQSNSFLGSGTVEIYQVFHRLAAVALFEEKHSALASQITRSPNDRAVRWV
jgi:hypothetical protein